MDFIAAIYQYGYTNASGEYRVNLERHVGFLATARCPIRPLLGSGAAIGEIAQLRRQLVAG
jgi:hypothetical protein